MSHRVPLNNVLYVEKDIKTQSESMFFSHFDKYFMHEKGLPCNDYAC